MNYYIIIFYCYHYYLSEVWFKLHRKVYQSENEKRFM